MVLRVSCILRKKQKSAILKNLQIRVKKGKAILSSNYVSENIKTQSHKKLHLHSYCA